MICALASCPYSSSLSCGCPASPWDVLCSHFTGCWSFWGQCNWKHLFSSTAAHGLPTLHTVPTLLLPLTYICAADPLTLCHIIKSPWTLTNSIHSLPSIETLKQAQWLSILRTSSRITVSSGIDLLPFRMLWDWGALGGWGLIFSVSLASPAGLSECYRIL